MRVAHSSIVRNLVHMAFGSAESDSRKRKRLFLSNRQIIDRRTLKVLYVLPPSEDDGGSKY